jgi:hypothetical protein
MERSATSRFVIGILHGSCTGATRRVPAVRVPHTHRHDDEEERR